MYPAVYTASFWFFVNHNVPAPGICHSFIKHKTSGITGGFKFLQAVQPVEISRKGACSKL